jgi:hypothetical protein
LRAISAPDPIATYTRDWRAYLAERLEGQPRGEVCAVIDCAERAVGDFRFCSAHVLGNESRFMDYAPMPKTLADVCEVEGCERISSGLSGLCVDHLRESSRTIVYRSSD